MLGEGIKILKLLGGKKNHIFSKFRIAIFNLVFFSRSFFPSPYRSSNFPNHQMDPLLLMHFYPPFSPHSWRYIDPWRSHSKALDNWYTISIKTWSQFSLFFFLFILSTTSSFYWTEFIESKLRPMLSTSLQEQPLSTSSTIFQNEILPVWQLFLRSIPP